jgi:hypothetical protein
MRLFDLIVWLIPILLRLLRVPFARIVLRLTILEQQTTYNRLFRVRNL